MNDKLIKALAYENEIRVYVIDATEMVAEAQRRHDTWATATAALGRAMIGTTLLGATLKGNDKITVRIEGDGPVGYILVDSNGTGQTKGYIHNPQVNLPLNEKGKLDVRGAVGTEGMLTVSKDLGMKKPFVGQVPLISGELGEDFTYYMANSEQVPSAVGVSVLVNPDETVKAAGGFMIQVLPGAKEETIAKIESIIETLPLVSTLMENGETPEKILGRLVGSKDYNILETTGVEFECDCSKERFADAIISLGVDEIQSMIDEDHGAEAVCHFCRTKYQYTESDLEELKIEAANQ